MHVMVDIETLGTGPRAIIAQIGAVAFSPLQVNDGLIFEESFSITIDIDQPGREFSAKTFYWWMAQSPAARNSVFPTDPDLLVSLRSALTMYYDWMKSIQPEKTWCNGATFDHVILQDAYWRLNDPLVKNPTHFRDMWDQRTAIGLFKAFGIEIPRPDYPLYIAHNAMHDAALQALWMQRYFEAVRLRNYEPGEENVNG